MNRHPWALAAAVVVAASTSAQAEPLDESDSDSASSGSLGYVVRIDFKRGAEEDEAEVYVDLGADRGATDGDKVTLLRDLTVRHPITKKPLRDLFPLAEVQVSSARGSMSLLVVPRAVAKLLRVGDRAALGKVPSPETSPQATAAAPTAPTRKVCPKATERPCPPCAAAVGAGPGADAATRTVLATWRATLGRPPVERITIWRNYVKLNPTSPHIDFARDEMERLRAEGRTVAALQKAEDAVVAANAAAARGAPGRQASPTTPVYHTPPREVREGEPVAVAAAPQDRAVRDVLLYFKAGETTRYQPVRLRPAGEGYFTGLIPAAAVRGPKLAYLLETVDDRGRRLAAVGNEAAPQSITVRESPGAEDLADRSRVSLRSEYVDFNRFRKGGSGDHYWILEGDFMYRLRTALHSIHAGFGTYNGVGGTFDRENVVVPDTHRTVGFNYAYVGFEFKLHEIFFVTARGLAGLNDDGLAGGIEGRIRIGREERTNLVLGVAGAQDIGTLGLIQLTWDVVRHFPMTGTVEVTDQPANGDVGVRFSYDLGWRALSWWYPTVRVSFQARTIDHYGFGAGVASVFAW